MYIYAEKKMYLFHKKIRTEKSKINRAIQLTINLDYSDFFIIESLSWIPQMPMKELKVIKTEIISDKILKRLFMLFQLNSDPVYGKPFK